MIFQLRVMFSNLSRAQRFLGKSTNWQHLNFRENELRMVTNGRQIETFFFKTREVNAEHRTAKVLSLATTGLLFFFSRDWKSAQFVRSKTFKSTAESGGKVERRGKGKSSKKTKEKSRRNCFWLEKEIRKSNRRSRARCELEKENFFNMNLMCFHRQGNPSRIGKNSSLS